MALRFAKPSTKTLDLPDGEWIEVREELSVGEQRKAYTAAVKGSTKTEDGTRTEYDAQRLSFALVVAYLVSWSVRDGKGQPVDITTLDKRRAAIEALDEESFNVIEAAIDAHVAEVTAAKKMTSEAASNSSATSPSVAG
jgi:hypothetical protein